MTSLLAAIASLVPAMAPGERGVLKALRWSEVGDTMRLEFEFSERPGLYRVRPVPGKGDRSALFVDFAGAAIDRDGGRNWPRWIRADEDSGRISFRVDLDAPVPWKTSWNELVLRVDLLDRVYRRPVWMNPWVIGAAGAGIAAGGVAFWVLGAGEPDPSPGLEEGVIPPPGFQLPGH